MTYMASKMAKLPPLLRYQFLRPPMLSHQIRPSRIIRSFHATHRRQFLEPVLLGTYTALDTIHNLTGTPWVFTLPLSALLVRLSIILPITIYQRKLLRKQVSLSPLIAGWTHVIKKQTFQEVGKQGPVKATAVMNKSVRGKQKEILKRWGCQRWKTNWIPVLQLPIWLVMIETIRRMCGGSEGLLAMLTQRLERLGFWKSGAGTEDIATAGASTTIEQIVPQTLGLEPGLASEGALWFPDLLVADPQLVLPFILSGAILLNIFGKTSAQIGPQTKWQMRIKRILGTVGLVAAPLTMQVPSAMLVYWISSTTLGFMQAVLLDRFDPIPKSIVDQKPKLPLMTPEGLPNTHKPKDATSKKP